MHPKPDAYYYKRHSDHAGFNPSPELKAVLDSRRREEEKLAAAAKDGNPKPSVTIDSPQ